MRTPEQLKQRRTRRQTRRYLTDHTPPVKPADPLQNGVVHLRSLLVTNRQDGLSK